MAERVNWRKRFLRLDQYGEANWNLSKKNQRRFLRLFWSVLSHSGDGLLTLILMGVVYIIGTPAWRTLILTLLAADILTAIAVRIVKVTVRRPRPAGDWGAFYRKTDPHSFPSGHAGRGGALGLASLLLMPWWIGFPVFIWGALVAMSRVIMGVHFTSDVVVGYIIGLVVALLVVIGRAFLV